MSYKFLQINGYEFAFISLLASENDVRFLSLSIFSTPSLYVHALFYHQNISINDNCKVKLLLIFILSLPGLRIPESLPCLHDKVLAASANPANISPSQKKVEVHP